MITPKRKILLNPGPATTSDNVKYAQVVSDICPREKEFTEVMREVRNSLVKIAGGDENYSCVLFGGSGTAAMDAVINSVVHNKKLLIINNGAYGDRFVKIAQTYKIDFVELKFDLDKEISLQEVEKILEEDKEIGFVAAVHHETTTGILNPIEELGSLCRRQGVLFIVDTISSFAGVPFSILGCNIDFMMSTSNKCIHGMPGVCFVIAKKTELEKLVNYEKRNFYLDLYNQYKSLEATGQTSFTPPVQTIYALREAINEFIKKGGINARYVNYSKNYEVLVEGLKKLGFEPMHRKEIHSKISTTFLEPENLKINLKELHDKLYERGITIYPNKVGNQNSIRFANMGNLGIEDINFALQNIREILTETEAYPSLKDSKNLMPIILVAGQGKRLRETWDNPKSLIEIEGKTILEYSLDALSINGINEAVLVIGYKGNFIKEKIGDFYNGMKIIYIENNDYLTTDTIYSLYKTKDIIDKDIVVFEGDVLYDPNLIKTIVHSSHDNFLILSDPINEKSTSLVFLDENNKIKKIGEDNGEEGKIIGEAIGVTRLSLEFVKGMFEYFEKKYLADGKDNYCEKLFYEFSNYSGNQLIPILIPNLLWTGVNTLDNITRLKTIIFPKIYKHKKSC